MAYREIAMWEILEVLRRVARGEGHRAIARVPGHSRSTIRRWLRVAEALGWEPATGGEPEEPLAVAVAQRVRPVRTSAEPGASQARLWRHREQIRAWLEPATGERGCAWPRSGSSWPARAWMSPTAPSTASRSRTAGSPDREGHRTPCR